MSRNLSIPAVSHRAHGTCRLTRQQFATAPEAYVLPVILAASVVTSTHGTWCRNPSTGGWQLTNGILWWLPMHAHNQLVDHGRRLRANFIKADAPNEPEDRGVLYDSQRYILRIISAVSEYGYWVILSLPIECPTS